MHIILCLVVTSGKKCQLSSDFMCAVSNVMSKPVIIEGWGVCLLELCVLATSKLRS